MTYALKLWLLRVTLLGAVQTTRLAPHGTVPTHAAISHVIKHSIQNTVSSGPLPAGSPCYLRQHTIQQAVNRGSVSIILIDFMLDMIQDGCEDRVSC